MTLRFTLIAALSGTVALTACTDPGVGYQGRTRDGAIAGALIGAAAGAVVGERKDRGKNAVLGAALGAGVGAAIGQGLDRQAAALEADLDDRVTVTNTGKQLIVTLPQDILFAVDSTALRPDLQSDLRVLARNLQEYPNSTVTVIGHTDNTGEAAYNQDLSARRASTVANVLISSGVPASRLRTIGRGEDAPVATNLTPEGRQQNRRVEIIINPTDA